MSASSCWSTPTACSLTVTGFFNSNMTGYGVEDVSHRRFYLTAIIKCFAASSLQQESPNNHDVIFIHHLSFFYFGLLEALRVPAVMKLNNDMATIIQI